MASWKVDIDVQQLIHKLQQDPTSLNKYKWQNNQLTRKGKVVVGRNVQLRNELVQYFHSSPVGGHTGVQKSLHKLKSMFY